MNANDANQPIAAAAEDAESDDTIADQEILLVVYDNEGQEIAENVTELINGKNITDIKKRACIGRDRLKEVDMSASLALKYIGDYAFSWYSALLFSSGIAISRLLEMVPFFIVQSCRMLIWARRMLWKL